MNWDNRQVLVTGAGGFIGSHLAEALVRAGAKVRAMIHYNARGDRGHLDWAAPELVAAMEVVASDVRDRSAVARAVQGVDTVFHLAALIGIPYSYQAAESYVQTNVAGTLNVLEACREAGVRRLLQTSTSEVYGTAQYVPIDERHPLSAQSPYAATKIAADQLALSYRAAFGVPAVVVRPFNTFGPRQSARAVIPTIITQAVAGQTVRLGSLEPVRDFLFVADNVRGFLAAAAADGVEGQVLNLATGVGVTIGEVVRLVGARLGRQLAVDCAATRQRPAASEVMRLIGSAETVGRLCGWQAEVPLSEGLAQTIEWFARHGNEYRAGDYAV